jgi:2-C-methyl-D-erythritol 4-phosphate cytidylyltransferase
MKQTCALVLAAGKGLRFNSRTPKALAKIRSKPVILYSLETLSAHSSLRDIIIVVNDRNSKAIEELVRRNALNKVRRIVRGGERRQDSVANALCVLENGCSLVLIHDAARPFVSRELISHLIQEATRCGAAIAGVPVKATIKRVVTKSTPGHKGLAGARSCAQSHKDTSKIIVEKTLDRSALWEIQTPQVFKKELILEAYKKYGRPDATDDAMLVEKLGKKVSIVLGSYDNIKITTPEDLVLAEAILSWNSKSA